MTKWQRIDGFADYEVSDAGAVRSFRRRGNSRLAPTSPRVLRATPDKDGYLQVSLRCDAGRVRTRKVAHLVLLAFRGPRPVGLEARHANGVRTDNRVANLAWSTHVANCADRAVHGTDTVGDRNGSRRKPWRVPRGERHHGARLNAQRVRALRRALAVGEDIAALGAEFGVSEMTARRAARGLSWTHVDEASLFVRVER